MTWLWCIAVVLLVVGACLAGPLTQRRWRKKAGRGMEQANYFNRPTATTYRGGRTARRWRGWL